MCGIVGFTGHRQAAPVLLDGLEKLEYRGYDSAGLAALLADGLWHNNVIFTQLLALCPLMAVTTTATNGLGMGLVTAAVLMLALSAPALSKRRTSATARTPPPTVKGMNTWLATRSITCKMVSRLSELAVMSKKVISSAPSSL